MTGLKHNSIKRRKHPCSPSRNACLKKESGVVLITVMLIFVVSGFIAVQIQEEQFFVHRITHHSVTQSQAAAYLRGAEALSKIVMREDERADEEDLGRKDYPDEGWTTIQSFPIDGGLLEGRLIDLQGRFNLNNLKSSTAARTVFLRLLNELGIPEDSQVQAQDLLDAILDWQDEDQEQRGLSDTEDYYYLGLNPPYRTSGQTLAHLSELNLLKGFSKADLKKLRPYISLLPEGTPININFIDAVMAAALNEKDGKAIFSDRPEQGYTQSEAQGLSKNQKPEIPYTTFSQFYELRIQVELNDETVRMRSFLYRPKNITPESPVRIMGRDTGNIILSS